MWLMVLFSAFTAVGQSTEPDVACVGQTRRYWVDSIPGHTYHWRIDGVTVQNGTIDMFRWTWTSVADYIVSVQETSSENCVGPWKLMPVHVINDPPTFVPPVLGTGYCVEDISEAEYNPAGTYDLKTDLIPPRPDYYLLTFGSTLLDYSTIIKSCPGNLTVSWVIDFAGALPPNLTGTGQISAAIPAAGIQFPVGNNVITWTVTDVAGNTTVYSVVLVVLPRPEIGDIPP
jgi:hypothetical protein